MTNMRYAYKYARIRLSDGLCVGMSDTTDYILDPAYVPIENYYADYILKYYYPIPTTVTSFDDFQGKWYTSSTHETEWIPE